VPPTSTQTDARNEQRVAIADAGTVSKDGRRWDASQLASPEAGTSALHILLDTHLDDLVQAQHGAVVAASPPPPFQRVWRDAADKKRPASPIARGSSNIDCTDKKRLASPIATAEPHTKKPDSSLHAHPKLQPSVREGEAGLQPDESPAAEGDAGSEPDADFQGGKFSMRFLQVYRGECRLG